MISGVSLYTATSKPALKVKILEENSKIQTQGSDQAVGYNIYSWETISIPPKEKKAVTTHIAIVIPTGTYGRITPHSGMTTKNSIDIGAEVIDADYQGHIKVVLINNGEQEFQVTPGDQIA